MDSSHDLGILGHSAEDEELDSCQSPERRNGEKVTSPSDMLRIKEQMSNRCFEMAVLLNAGKVKRSCSTTEAERDLPDYVTELEDAKTMYFTKTMTLHRMQMSHAITEKLKQNDLESVAMKELGDRCMAFSSRIIQLQQESKELEDQVTEIQKKRLELKRLTHEKMKEIDELMYKKEHPDMEKYKAALQKGQENLEKYKNMANMTQNVLRGILLACQVNWLDDPKVRAIAMTLEDLPISD